MDENLGTLRWDFRAQLSKFFQDCNEADARVSALRQKWSQPFSLGGPGGGNGGTVGAGHSSATMAGAQATMVSAGGGGGGGGPNFSGTSNGDVTWNLRQASRDTQARYSGGRFAGGAGMEDGAPDQRIGDVAGDFVRGSRMRMLLSDSREQSRRAGVLEQQQDKYGELESRYRLEQQSMGVARSAQGGGIAYRHIRCRPAYSCDRRGSRDGRRSGIGVNHSQLQPSHDAFRQ